MVTQKVEKAGELDSKSQEGRQYRESGEGRSGAHSLQCGLCLCGCVIVASHQGTRSRRKGGKRKRRKKKRKQKDGTEGAVNSNDTNAIMKEYRK